MAQQELPTLDNTHRSAVSLARRLLDPLAEFVKIPPKSLGVGQYQHSVPEKTLETEAENCFVEAISKVGVDLSTCSAELLQYVPGLGEKRAKMIIENRGKLKKKKDLLEKMKGIGEKIFEQVKGFFLHGLQSREWRNDLYRIYFFFKFVFYKQHAQERTIYNHIFFHP